MRSTKIGTAALAGLLALTLAACGGEEETAAPAPSTSSSSEAPEAEAEPVVVPDLSGGVSTAVTLETTFLDALTERMVMPGVIGSATLDGAVLSFPITGGDVTVYPPGSRDPYVEGEVQHNGSGLSLTAGGIKVDLENFVVDPGTSMLTGRVSANGMVAAESAPLFFLDGSTLQPLRMEGPNAVLEGTVVKIAPEAAALLNTTFAIEGTPAAIPDYFEVGVAKITVNPAA